MNPILNPVLIQILKWALEKALIESGKEADWAAIKKDAMALLDQVLPSGLFDTAMKYLMSKLLDLIQEHFVAAVGPITPDVIHAAVDSAKDSIAWRVATEFLSTL